MKNLIFCLLVLAPGIGWGQKDLEKRKINKDLCKVEVDEFTKAKAIRCDFEKIGKNKSTWSVEFLKATVSKSESTYILTLVPEFYDIKTIHKGDKVYIKFTDESIMELEIHETTISKPGTGERYTQGTRTVWYNVLGFILTPEQVLQLEAKKILKVRCALDDFDVKDKNSLVVSDMIRCILSKE